MIKNINIILLAGLTFFMFGCEEEPEATPSAATLYSDGVLIVNEGPFGNGTGSITYSKRDWSFMEQNIYQGANNGLPLGSVAQSLTVIGDKAYILVNNANTIEVANRHNFKLISTIQNIELPRFMIQVTENKSYVTCWDGKIKVLDTEKDKVFYEIEGSAGQEKLLKVNNEAWVLNQGGYGVDSTISVINIATNQIEQTIYVYPRPSGICEDKQGLIWVICSGRASYHTGGASEGHLMAINKSTYLVEKDFAFPDNIKQPSSLIINATGNELFFLYPGGINRFQTIEDTLVLSPFISYSGSFYSIGYDPKENKIWASDALDYVQNGPVLVYDATTGIEIRSFKAGIVPTNFYFSE